MAAKKVTGTIPAHKVEPGNRGVEFAVRDGDDLMGRLKVCKARVVWIPKDKTYGKELSWEKVRDLFEKHGTVENGK
jgi:hypothetical protein